MINRLPQVAALTKNTDAVKAAQRTVKELAGSRRERRSSFRHAQVLESCGEVQTVANKLTALVQENPASSHRSIVKSKSP